MISLISLGTVQSYTQSMKAKGLWEQRKQNGFYDQLSEKDSNRAAMQEQVDRMHDIPESDMQIITSKLQQGKPLNFSEKEKLRTADPELYEKVQKIEDEQKQYEQALKRCRTKDEVQRLKMNKLQASLHTINAVSNNPNIPLEKKLEIAQEENMRVRAVNRSTEQFVMDGSYAKLPTQQEVDAARKEEQEQRRPQPPEQTIEPEPVPDATHPPEQPPQPAPQLPGQGDKVKQEPGKDMPEQGEKAEQASAQTAVETKRVLASYRRGASFRPPDFRQLMDDAQRTEKK